MKDAKIRFANIDAKDDPFTWYSGKGRLSLCRKNAFLSAMMEREYLVLLASLQEDIRSRYEHLWCTEDDIDGIDYSVAAARRARKVFPGPTAAYYT